MLKTYDNTCLFCEKLISSSEEETKAHVSQARVSMLKSI